MSLLTRLAAKILNRDVANSLPKYEPTHPVRECCICGMTGTMLDGLHSNDGYILCRQCNTSSVQTEINRLRSAKSRSRKHGTHYNINLFAWMQTIVDFRGMCAYCQMSKGDTLDHFIPIQHGGATVISNLLPACQRCNSRKGDQYPSQIEFITDKRLSYLADYLRSRELTP